MNTKVPTRLAERFTLLNHPRNHRAEALGFVQLVRRRCVTMSCCAVNDTWQTRDVDTTRLQRGLRLVRPANGAQAEEAVRALKAGKVIAVPTDTLYGFACDACSKEAVNKIYKIKGREHTKPLAICVGDTTDIQRFAVTDHLPPGLLDALFPGPVTAVLKRGESSILDKSLNPEADSIGVRVPDCDFIRIIANGSGSALALTSANLSGNPSSVCITDFENLWEQCAYVYDGGVLPSGRAGSTVVRLTKPGKYKILRAGSAKKETVAILEGYCLIEDGGGDESVRMKETKMHQYPEPIHPPRMGAKVMGYL